MILALLSPQDTVSGWPGKCLGLREARDMLLPRLSETLRDSKRPFWMAFKYFLEMLTGAGAVSRDL